MENQSTTNQCTKIDWPSHISAWRKSGLAMNAYCLKQGLAVHQLGYYKRKLELKASEQYPKGPSSGFAQVSVAKVDQACHQPLSLCLPCGHVIKDISEHNVHLVVKLLGALS